MPRMLFFCLLLLTAVVQCASYESPPVPLLGDSNELAQMAGEWTGRYESRATGRSGSIVFNFAGTSDGHGDVVMNPPLHMHLDWTESASVAQVTTPVSDLVVIPIRYIRVDRGIVFGELESYEEPGSDRPVTTSFVGSVEGDHIRGTFTMRSPQARESFEGTWRVSRQRPRP